MTAEIVILNKTGVALAADSVVTLSAGNVEKVFETEDKLFELSDHCPLGIMIYNATSFMDAPIPNLIREFRSIYKVTPCTVYDAFESFLTFLYDYYKSTTLETKQQALRAEVKAIVQLIIDNIQERVSSSILKRICMCDPYDKINLICEQHVTDINKNEIQCIINESIEHYETNIHNATGTPCFFGSVDNEVKIKDVIAEVINESFGRHNNDIIKRISKICKALFRKNISLGNHTGLVITGFGEKQLFPSLVSCELNGVIDGRLRYGLGKQINMNEDNSKSHVLPFAQTEMVERFLYGIDQSVISFVLDYFKQIIIKYRNEIIAFPGFCTEEIKSSLMVTCENIEQQFNTALLKKLETISHDMSEIETMVEFMPKPELANMAEALVNLTSIKRHVSRGIETVGGPIDVALICRSEGFVWIRRKHYFPADLNARYFLRLEQARQGGKEESNAHIQ